MENRVARLTILIDPEKKAILEEICAKQDLTTSQVIRKLLREYIKKNGSPGQIARMPHNKPVE